MRVAENWPGTEIGSWSAFQSQVDQLIGSRIDGHSYVFRGQAREGWRLAPSVVRGLSLDGLGYARELETAAVREFRAQAHLHYPGWSLPTDDGLDGLLQWWALMQHHSAPTRLLDWSKSPYVGAYFAVEQEPNQDGVIYVVSVPQAHARFDQLYGLPVHGLSVDALSDPARPDAVFFFSPPIKSARLVAQQGFFSASVNLTGLHDALIADSVGPATSLSGQDFLRRWIIPASLKRDFLRQLRLVNIAAHSLFPGIDGLGRSIAEIVKTSAYSQIVADRIS